MFGITEDGTYRVESIGFSTPTLDSGYVVAVRPIKREADIVTEGALFGRWTDQDGTVYWDEVEIVPSLLTALQTAHLRSETAVWGIAEGKEYRVSDWYPTIAPEPAYSLRIMTVDGIEEETTGYTAETDAWDAYDAAAAWGMGWYRTLTNDQGTVLAEGVTA
jgi:hypothetical protein